jgi:hypothetical protein
MIVRAMAEFRAAFHELSNRPIPPAWDEKLDAYTAPSSCRGWRQTSRASAAASYEPGSIAGRYLQHRASPRIRRRSWIAPTTTAVRRRSRTNTARSCAGRALPLLRSLLIDLDTGDIVYTVRKRPTSPLPRNGPYRESNLAQLFKTVREEPDRGSVHCGLQGLPPVLRGAAAFIATPIYDGKKAIGVLGLLPVMRSTTS